MGILDRRLVPDTSLPSLKTAIHMHSSHVVSAYLLPPPLAVVCLVANAPLGILVEYGSCSYQGNVTIVTDYIGNNQYLVTLLPRRASARPGR